MGYRRKKYTPEQRAERDAADKAIKDAADEKLTDPEAVAAMVGQLAQATSPKLLRYSLRNVAMLWNQAEERGITLTDVDSFKGWKARGRSIRKGERALRIVAPKGTEKAEGSDTAEPEPAEFITVDTDDQGDETAARTRFRMVVVFDISQTEGIEDFEGDPVEVEPVADPAGVVRANLTTQLERLGYAVATTDDEQPAPVVDDDAHAVTVSAARPVEQLAQAVAELITRPADQRPRPVHTATSTTATEPRPAAAPGIPLDLGEFGEGRAVVEIDHDNGRAYYRVTGPNVRGCFTVAWYEPAEKREPHIVNVIYGHDNGRGGPWVHGGEGEKRPERPTVNGIRLVAQSTHITLAEIETMRTIYVMRMVAGRYNPYSERVPDRTEQRTRAVVRAILRHFAQLPELPELFARAAALDAPALQRIHNERAATISAHITRLEHEREEAETQRRYYASLAAGGEIDGTQLEMFSA
ncbi:ArdC family protein [Nocardia amamiensis]|uniref:ArdC family protein n=1 Tax=Nocardia amamiensis TaxID=404578 RepID=UPI000833F9FE|nr:ArdC family protein [Nocardia amamiensis]